MLLLRSVRFAACSITIALSAGALSSCAQKSETAAPKAHDPPPVTARVSSGEVVPAITLSGLIAPHQNVSISSALQEPAVAVYVNEGDYVHAGQVLAQLDVADLRANYDAANRSADQATTKVAQTRDQGILNIQQGTADLVTAKSQLEQAEQKFKLSSVTLQRDEQLYSQGYLSHQTLDSDSTQYRTDEQSVHAARAALRSALATVLVNGSASRGLQRENVVSARAAAASARAQAEQIAVQMRKATIRAPVDGIVINRNINVGQYPGNSQIFVLQEISTVYAMLNASSDQVFRIRQGDAAKVNVMNLHAPQMQGVVEAVLGQAEPGATNFVVKVRLFNPQRTLQSGMLVSARIALPPVSGTMVPTSAFVDAAHDAVRTAQRDGTTRMVPVRDLASDGSHSIVQGLAAGSRVVLQQQ
jgi:HlyD family secretion protein